MSIQEEQAEGQEAQATGAEGKAEYSDAWDEIEAEETGQPSKAEGRHDEAAEADQADEQEAGQGEADEAVATPTADADPASRVETTDDEGDHAKLLEAEREARIRAENLARSHGGRLAQALNELADLKKSLKSEKAEGATPEGEEATDEDERIKQLREDYPEVAEPLLEKIAKLEADVKGLGAAEAAPAGEPTEADIEALYAEQLTALQERHDDYADVVRSPAYTEWLARTVDKDALILRVIQENSPRIVNAAECAAVFDRFKTETGWGQAEREAVEKVGQKRERQLRAGTEAPSRQPAVTRDEEGSYDSEWDRLDRMERQRSAGGRR